MVKRSGLSAPEWQVVRECRSVLPSEVHARSRAGLDTPLSRFPVLLLAPSLVYLPVPASSYERVVLWCLSGNASVHERRVANTNSTHLMNCPHPVLNIRGLDEYTRDPFLRELLTTRCVVLFMNQIVMKSK